jgi:hypothetical protein
LDRTGEVALFDGFGELDGVHVERRAAIDRHVGISSRNRPLAQCAPQRRQRVAQRVPRATLVVLRPEETKQRVAGKGAARQGQHREHRQLESPTRQRCVFLTAGSHERQAAKGDESEAVVPQHVDAVRCG